LNQTHGTFSLAALFLIPLGGIWGCGSEHPPAVQAQGPQALGVETFLVGLTRAVQFSHYSQPVLVFWFDCDGDPKALQSLSKKSVIPGARGVAPGDRNGGWKVGGSSAMSGMTTLRSEVRASDGRHIHFEWRTIDGRSGKILIGKDTYDLANGDLFLVKTRDEPPTIRQLSRNFRKTRLSGGHFLKKLSSSDSDIAQFIAGVAVPLSLSGL